MARQFRSKRRNGLSRARNRNHTTVEPAAFDLMEEGVHLLRRTTASAWICYLVGSGPFVVAFILFWNDMSHSGLAEQSLSYYAFGMALLYLWMKCWQCMFARSLRATLYLKEGDPMTFQTVLAMMRRQATWQGLGFICIPFAFVATIPFPRVYAFLHNMTVMDAVDKQEDSSKVVERSWKLAALWPGQSWFVVGIILLVGIVTFVNWFSVIAMLPYLLKMLFGVETSFVKSGFAFFNSTTFSTSFALTYLTLDPLVKAVYLLRCHYGESVQSGADLRLALVGFTRRMAKVGISALLLFLVGMSFNGVLKAEDVVNNETITEASIQSNSLDSAIDDTLRQREYIWRFPKEEVDESIEPPGWIQAILDTMDEWQERITEWIRSWFRDELQEDQPRELVDAPSLGWPILITIIVVAVVAIAYLGFRLFGQRKPGVAEAEAASLVEAVPNLADEDVRADSLPSNQWLDMARDLLAKGDYRLALRAFFLAQLAHFAQQRWIVIQRFKSNRDYVYELSKRAAGTEELLNTFRSEIRLFEDIWYGGYQASQDEVKEMQRLLIQSGALQAGGDSA
ncbi:DUF4129 domain-containing protein [Rubellicoccus peritrichatus]|uniref:DUF4129 domain-containing protein n=1 Tax=Rubellicoccus peritrichatus TaxID=3080537 RepID=A0AAQ3L9N6_9BACT|nr:DUF4129 domain-containing protein [Puniceicoccus sp. CR14]WOO42179.1 DUF4129 domain-containing protein [Puniceicoccus sp. CR14]